MRTYDTINLMLKLTKSKLRTLANICINFSTVFLASLVVPVFTSESSSLNLLVVFGGIIGTITFIILALICAERGKI